MSEYDPIKLVQARDEERGRERIAELERELSSKTYSLKVNKLDVGVLNLALNRASELERENAELKAQQNALVSLIWETRWVSEDHDYQNLVGIAAEIRSGNLGGLNKETANRDQLRLQVARLREALTKLLACEQGVNCISASDQAKQALAETQ